jgi:hypothetical protein
LLASHIPVLRPHRRPGELVNNFWPTKVVSTASGYLALISKALPGMARAALEYLEAQNQLDDQAGYLTVVNTPIEDRVLFFSGKFSEHFDEDQAEIVANTWMLRWTL